MPTDLPANAQVHRHSLGEAMHKVRRNWLWMVLFGAALDLAGLLALGSLGFATLTTVLLIGFTMLFGGAIELGMGFRAKDWSHFFLWVIGGLLYIGAGLFTVMYPLLASLVLTLFLGAGLIAAGVVRVFHALQMPTGHHRWLFIASGVASMLLGLVIVLHWPVSGIFVLGMLLAFDLIFHGISWMVFGFWLRNFHHPAKHH